ncbi:MAG: TolC family protein [Spirochaetota bacterium]
MKPLFLLICAPLAFAAEARTLAECFASARTNDAVLIQRETLTQTEERAAQAFGAFFPTVAASGSILLRNNIAHDGLANSSYGNADAQGIKLSVTQPIFRGFRYIAALDAANNNLAAEKENRDWLFLALYADTAAVFYSVLALENDRELLSKQDAAYNDRINDLKRRVAIGRSRPTEVLTVEAARAQLSAVLEAVSAQCESARDVFSFLTKLDRATTLSDAAELDLTLDNELAYRSLAAKRPDVRALQKKWDAAKANTAIARAALFPSVDVGVNAYANRGGTASGSSADVAWDVQLTFSYALDTAGVFLSKMREIESLERQASLVYAQALRAAERDITSLHHVAAADIAQLAALTKASELAERNYRETLNDYNYSLVKIQDVLTALISYQDTKRTLDRMRFTAKSDLIKLESISTRLIDRIRGN